MNKLSAAVFLALIVVLSGCAARQELVRESAASVILIPENPTETELFAANELQKYLKEISGAKIMVTGDFANLPPSKSIISVGRTPLLNRSIVAEPQGGGLVIKTIGDKLFILGGQDGPGTLYGVYAFLELLGCRWYSSGPMGEYLPQTEKVDIGRIDIKEIPANQLRGLYFTPDTFSRVKLTPAILAWMGQNRLNTLLFIDSENSTVQPETVLADLLPELRKRGIRPKYGKYKDYRQLPASNIYRQPFPLLTAMGAILVKQDQPRDEIYLDAACVTAQSPWKTPLPWLAALGFWTPNGNAKFLIADYCRKNFGSAADELKSFYENLNQQTRKAGSPQALMTVPAWKYLFPEPVMEKARALLRRAGPLTAIAISPEPARRVKSLKNQLQAIEFMKSFVWDSRSFPSKNLLRKQLQAIAEYKKLPDTGNQAAADRLGKLYEKILKYLASTPMVSLEDHGFRVTFSPNDGRILEFGNNEPLHNLLAAYLPDGKFLGGAVSRIRFDRAPGCTPLPFKPLPDKMNRTTGVLIANCPNLRCARTIKLDGAALTVTDIIANPGGESRVYNLDLEFCLPFGFSPRLPEIPGHYRLKLHPAIGNTPVELQIAGRETRELPPCRDFTLLRADGKSLISGKILSGSFSGVAIEVFADTIIIRLKGETTVLDPGKTIQTSCRITAGK